MKMRSRLSQLYSSVLVNSIYPMKNHPIILLNTILGTFGVMAVVIFISHGALLDVALVGAFMMSIIFSGVGIQQDLAHLKIDLKWQDMVVSSPTSAVMYVIGMAISELAYSIPTFILLGALIAIFVHITLMVILTISAAIIVMFVMALSIGFLLSTVSSDIIQNFAFGGVLSVILSTISPIYYPITYIPLPFRYLAYLSPTTYAAEIAQNALGLIHLSSLNISLDWVITLAIASVALVIAIKKSQWREKD